MKAIQKNETIKARIEQRLGIVIPLADADTLRLAELTLSRWSEAECGDANGNAIERDEATGIPYRTFYIGTRGGKRGQYRIPDRETGALRRVAKVCEQHGLAFYHQGDPRGCALYVGKPGELTGDNYSSRGVALCV